MSDVVAKLRKVIWRSLENDFTIAAFQPEKDGSGHDLEFIATGDIYNPAEGITYEMSGEWEEHAKYGKQFKISSYCVQAPCDSESIAVYLSKHIKGVGPVMADLLIEKYRQHTIKILKGSPERVSDEIKGLSYAAALKISEQLQEGDKRQDELIKLEGIFSKVKGLPKKLAADLLNTYGLTAHEVVKNNPYVLIEMNRVGFLSADKVAMAIGIKPDAPERIRQGIIYVIKQTMNESGDVWIERLAIFNELSKLITGLKEITTEITELIDNGALTRFDIYVTLTQFADDESLIADCVTRFVN